MAMLDRDLRIARELKEQIAASVPLVDFKVFGSRARGDADEDSDMDVFIEVEELDRAIKEKISDITWEVGINNDCMVICTLVYSRYDLEKSPHRVSPIVKVIMEEGIRI